MLYSVEGSIFEFGPCPIYAHGSSFLPNPGIIMMIIIMMMVNLIIIIAEKCLEICFLVMDMSGIICMTGVFLRKINLAGNIQQRRFVFELILIKIPNCLL